MVVMAITTSSSISVNGLTWPDAGGVSAAPRTPCVRQGAGETSLLSLCLFIFIVQGCCRFFYFCDSGEFVFLDQRVFAAVLPSLFRSLSL